MALTYAYCEGRAEMPYELQVDQLIKHYGVKPVTGLDVLPPQLVRRLQAARVVHDNYSERAQAEDLSDWLKHNSSGQRLLDLAYHAAIEQGLYEDEG